jgi:predicted ATP-dependent serine protease
MCEGEDVFDFVEQLKVAGYDKPQIQVELQKVIHSARPKGPADKLTEKIEKIIAGKLETIKFPFRWTSFLSNALLPGTLTILCGGIGASKSFMLLQCLMYWNRQSIRACCYMLEEDMNFHTQRALAQLAGISKLTDLEYIRENQEIARQAMAEHYDFLNDFGHCIETSPTSQQNQPQIAEWILSKAKQGNRIICIDPITAAAQTKETWIADNTFLQAIKRTATDYNISIVLVTHPTKTVSCPDMNQLAGSAAYARFAQSILWLENHEGKMNLVEGDCGTTEVEYNRTLHLLKCRNGAGQGKKIAFEFGGDSLLLRELGLIVKK